MKLEDYFKYYIQGSDHYLIPKDVFEELFNEIIIDLQQENQELKKQLEDEIKLRNKILINCVKLRNQQKEFIEYMNKTIEELECDDVGNEEMKGYLIQRIDTFKEILQKYEGIIGEINNE